MDYAPNFINLIGQTFGELYVFEKDKRGDDGVDLTNARPKGSREVKKDALAGKSEDAAHKTLVGKIKCSICEEEKDATAFEVNRRQCNSCRKEQNKIRKQNRSEEEIIKAREKGRESGKKWAKENPEKRDAIYARYRKTDKRKKVANEWARRNIKSTLEYRRNRYNSDPVFNIAIKLRRRIYMALKTQEKIKGSRTIDLLGCSFEDLKGYIETLFREGMTWEKVSSGEIQLDHVLPCAFFDLTTREEQEKCFHFTNLQPLWKSENGEKSDFLDWRDRFEWAKDVVELRKKRGLE